jgi:3-dehydroquinate synthase
MIHPIHIDNYSLNNSELFDNYIQHHRIIIVSDPCVSQLYLSQLKATLRHRPCHAVLIPEGEQHKTLATWQQILDNLFSHGYGRDTLLIALGGGMVSDIAGFAAATYQRGIPWISIPTTLLAQVDASIGGKTAVNHPGGKNMIGAFHQPSAVIIDPRVLESLPEREFRSGLAEVIKYGLIYDADFFTWLEINMVSCAARDPAALSQAIKASIVMSDEKDIADKRAILNFGHTFGHAMENVSGYCTLLHGEAVAIGMVMAATLSVQIYGLPESVLSRIKRILEHAQLPLTRPTTLSPEQIVEAMRMDKKNHNNTLRLVLLKSLGEAVVADINPMGIGSMGAIPMDQIKKIIREN